MERGRSANLPKAPSNLPRRRSSSKLPPQYRASESNSTPQDDYDGIPYAFSMRTIPSDKRGSPSLPPPTAQQQQQQQGQPQPAPQSTELRAPKSRGSQQMAAQRQLPEEDAAMPYQPQSLKSFQFPSQLPPDGAGQEPQQRAPQQYFFKPEQQQQQHDYPPQVAQPQQVPQPRQPTPLAPESASTQQPLVRVREGVMNSAAVVTGTEHIAPLPRLQGSTERALDRSRNVVLQFVSEKCPDRAARIEGIMNKFEGREDLLVEALTAVFGEDSAKGSNNNNKEVVASVPASHSPLVHRAVAAEARTTLSLEQRAAPLLRAPPLAETISTQSRENSSEIGHGVLTTKNANNNIASYDGLVSDAMLPPTSGGMLTPQVPDDLVYRPV